MQKDSYQSLLNYAFRLLGRKNYTEWEMERKLMQRGLRLKLSHAEAAVKKVVKRLKQLKYLDDRRILEDYFEYRLSARPQGKFAFLHRMHRRGIPLKTAASEWDKRGISEQPLALSLLQHHKIQLENLPPVLRRQKIARLLATHGFSSDTVWGISEKDMLRKSIDI